MRLATESGRATVQKHRWKERYRETEKESYREKERERGKETTLTLK